MRISEMRPVILANLSSQSTLDVPLACYGAPPGNNIPE